MLNIMLLRDCKLKEQWGATYTIKMAHINKSAKTKCNRGCGAKELFLIDDGSEKW